MANLSKVHESCLPDKGQERRKLIGDIKRVAAEIEFTGYRDTGILAKELDRRGVYPLRHNYQSYHGYHQRRRSKWYDETEGSSNPSGKLRGFIKKHIPELFQQEPQTSNEAPLNEMSCLCHKCSARTICLAYCTNAVAAPDIPLDKRAVGEKPTKKSSNINGWTVRQDKKDYYRGYKRIDGKVRSKYIGKSLDGAEAKLTDTPSTSPAQRKIRETHVDPLAYT